jgi:hypothetical protein
MWASRRAAGSLLAITVAALAAAPAFAQDAPKPEAPASAPQDPEQASLRKKFEEKVSHAWFKDGGWTDDYDAALARAKAEKKPIFAYFSRSYSP